MTVLFDPVPRFVSIPAPLARSNPPRVALERDLTFQYLLLLRGATRNKTLYLNIKSVSIPAPLARSNRSGGAESFLERVSIPAPLARSNCRQAIPGCLRACFNTCSSCEEQPGTNAAKGLSGASFNTCSSCEEQLIQTEILVIRGLVSIPAPLARSNRPGKRGSANRSVSIPAPLARSNYGKPRIYFTPSVSIPAPLARSNVTAQK